jgi:hypothetical protein
LAQEPPSATIVYVDDDAELLELTASHTNGARRFHVHDRLDGAALVGADEALVIAREADVDRSAAFNELHAVTLPALFPSGTDPFIRLLRNRAARDRHDVSPGDEMLFAADRP